MDGDDTLWENNIYFERAIEEFIDLVLHETTTRAELRLVLDQIELVNCQRYGYGTRTFVRSLRECYEAVRTGTPPDGQVRAIADLGERILSQHLEVIVGVPETLEHLRRRHRLLLLTKGDHDEQAVKVERSGLRPLFEDVVIVAEKTADVYSEVVARVDAEPDRTWMIGNSPKSDIAPALAAGLRAVFVPHEMTWVLEQQPLPEAPGRLLLVERFSDLAVCF